jgi:hypothetical protein
MPIVLRRELAIPLWGVAFCLVAFSEPQRVLPFLMALFGIGVIASAIPAIVRRFGPSRQDRSSRIVERQRGVARSAGSQPGPDFATTRLTHVP